MSSFQQLVHASFRTGRRLTLGQREWPQFCSCLDFRTKRLSVWQSPKPESELTKGQEKSTSRRRSSTDAIVDKLSSDSLPMVQSRGLMTSSSTSGSHHQSRDLYRFLEEVGTDPKEARYWLKYFQRESHQSRPFAVILLEQSAFDLPDILDDLCSTLAFLQRNGMPTILIHGLTRPEISYTSSDRVQLSARCTMLASLLESHGASARPLFAGANLLRADEHYQLDSINTSLLQWCLQTGHLPVIPATAETADGRIVPVSSIQVMNNIAIRLQPMKVILVNSSGGIQNQRDKVVANVHLPRDLELPPPWMTPSVIQKTLKIHGLLQKLNPHSSVILTAASHLMTELFTHHGSGTFFKITEPIHVHDQLTAVDQSRLVQLLITGFGKDLRSDYMEHLKTRVEKVFISESYSAAAVITREAGVPVPYLDKFVVSAETQGLGTAGMLWDAVRSNYPSLFWRSHCGNKINPWYFDHADGSFRNGTWIVFWYGIQNPRETSDLIDFALNLDESFTGPGNIGEFSI